MIRSIEDVVTHALEAGEISGAVVVVTRDGETAHSEARGELDPVTHFALETDSVLWLASLSKVVCSTAVLMLVDAGVVQLDDPVSRFIPEFAAPGRVRVLAPGSPPVRPQPPFAPPPDPMPRWDMVAATRQILVRDLLTHTSGLQSFSVYNPDYHRPQLGDTLASHVPTLATVPRDFQAGTAWAYSNSAAFDILARVVEVASAEPFNIFVRRRLVEPLGLEDLGFALAGSPRAMPLDPEFAGDPVLQGQGYYSGAAGMWGSLGDYSTFVEMIRTGHHEGAQLLTPESIRQLITNQVDDLCPGLNGRPPSDGVGFGLGVAVITDAAGAETALPNGTFGWDGVGSRRFWCQPDQGWSAVMYIPHQAVQARIETALVEALA